MLFDSGEGCSEESSSWPAVQVCAALCRGNAVLSLTGQLTLSPETQGICRAAAAIAVQFWKEEDYES